MTENDERKRLELELLATELKLRRKQEFWETPRNIAILVGITAAIAAAIGFWLGRWGLAPPAERPFPIRSFGSMTGGEFVDAIQTASLAVLTLMVVYVVVRLDRTLTGAATEIKSALTAQSNLAQTLARTWKRLEAVEHLVRERNEILPTELEELRDRLDRLEGKGEHEIR